MVHVVGGYNWGPRLIVPTIPLLAVLAGAGIAALPQRQRTPVAAVVLTVGLVWALPGITVDLLGGYGGFIHGSAASFRVKGYPPLGAWEFVDHWFATSALDNKAIDIFWLRFARPTKGASLVPFFVSIIAAVLLLRRLLQTHSSRSRVGPSAGEAQLSQSR